MSDRCNNYAEAGEAMHASALRYQEWGEMDSGADWNPEAQSWAFAAHWEMHRAEVLASLAVADELHELAEVVRQVPGAMP